MIGAKSIEMAKLQSMKLPSILALFALLVLLVAAGSFWAGRQSTPDSSVGAKGERTYQVSIEARDVDVTEVLRSFASQIGAALAVDTDIHGKISIMAKDSNLTEVMNDLCLVHQCQWRLSENGDLLTVTKKPQV